MWRGDTFKDKFSWSKTDIGIGLVKSISVDHCYIQ
uniref:Uncharacterized protein n=1 Tax=Anguilla anguilla TaxID=7936 RepID=A0A0E9UT57_ANGAN